MLTIQITSEEIKNPVIYKALKSFFASVSKETSVSWNEKKPSRPRCNKPAIKIVLDSEIERKMSDSIKTARSLYFLTLIKREGRISTQGITTSMVEAFPDFTPKSLGGLTGSITRWCNQTNLKVPFECSRDMYNTTTIYTWEGFKKKKK